MLIQSKGKIANGNWVSGEEVGHGKGRFAAWSPEGAGVQRKGSQNFRSFFRVTQKFRTKSMGAVPLDRQQQSVSGEKFCLGSKEIQ